MQNGEKQANLRILYMQTMQTILEFMANYIIGMQLIMKCQCVQKVGIYLAMLIGKL